jgi:WD40 repeat protein
LFTVVLRSGAPVQAEATKPAENHRAPLPIAALKRSSPVDFEKEILPILTKNCLACHNQTKAKADLILETPQTILQGGESGPAVVPKRSDRSLLLKAATHQDPELIMPPRDNKVAASNLTPDELGLLKLWIDQGAKGSVRAAAPVQWQPLPPGLNPILAVALTADGQFAACARANQIFLYHLPSGQLVTRLSDPQLAKAGLAASPGVAHRDLAQSLAFSPAGDLLASGSYREVKLWRRAPPAVRHALATTSGKAVRCVGVSPDGRWFATGDAEGRVTLWSAARGRRQKDLAGHSAGVNALAFSADGVRLVSSAADKSLRLWSVPDGRLVAQAEAPSEVQALTWLHAPARIATGGADGVIRLWEPPATSKGDWTPAREFKGHEGGVTALAARGAEDTQLLSGGADGVVRLWDVEKAGARREFKHGAAVTAVAARGDGQRFAAAGTNHLTRLWDPEKTDALTELKGNRYASETVAARERALTLARADVEFQQAALKTAETNRTAAQARLSKATETNAAAVKVFEEKQKALSAATEARAAAEKALADFGPGLRQQAAAVEAASKAAAEAESALKSAKEKDDKPAIARLTAESEAKAKALAEAKAAFEKRPAEQRENYRKAAEKAAATAKALSDAEKDFQKARERRGIAEHELALATDAEKKAVETQASTKAALEAGKEALQRAEAALASAQKVSADAEKSVRALAFSRDGRALVTAGDDGAVHTWSAETGAAFDVFEDRKAALTSVAFVGGERIIASGADGRLATWELTADWTLERTLGTGDASSPLADRVNALCFSPDGRFVATGGGEPTRGGEIKVWQVADGKLAGEFKNVHSDTVFALDFSRDGSFLASGAADRFAKVVEVATGKVVKTYEGHTHHVLGVSWKADGRTLVTAGADNVVKVWDVTSGERRKNVEGAAKEVTTVAFVGVTGEFLAASGDGQLRLLRENGDKVRSFEGASDFLHAAAVTPDGLTVIAGGQESVLRVWDGTSAKLRVEFGPPAVGAVTAAKGKRN